MSVNGLVEATQPREIQAVAHAQDDGAVRPGVFRKGQGRHAGAPVPRTHYTDVVLDVSLLASRTPVPARGTSPVHKLHVCERR